MTGLSIASIIFTAIAAWFCYSGFATPIDTDGNQIANLQLMHIQSVNFAIGIGAAIVAALLAVGAAILIHFSNIDRST